MLSTSSGHELNFELSPIHDPICADPRMTNANETPMDNGHNLKPCPLGSSPQHIRYTVASFLFLSSLPSPALQRSSPVRASSSHGRHEQKECTQHVESHFIRTSRVRRQRRSGSRQLLSPCKSQQTTPQATSAQSIRFPHNHATPW